VKPASKKPLKTPFSTPSQKNASLLTEKAIQNLFQIFQTLSPKPQSDLYYNTPFECLSAVLLSAHTTDKSVNAATKKLFPIANTPNAFLKLGVSGLSAYLKTVGLYPTKTKHLLQLSQQLIDNHDGAVPRTRNELEKLPGVGRKTANVVLNALYNEATIAVDTHVFRVAQRLGIAYAKTPLALEPLLYQRIPKAFHQKASHWLILHGRQHCKAQKPLCSLCPLNKLCLGQQSE
jgi:endonuclease III